MDQNNLDEIFNADSLFGLLDEITEQEEISEKAEQAAPIVAEAVTKTTEKENSEWIDGILEDLSVRPDAAEKLFIPKSIEEFSRSIYSDAQLSEISKGLKHHIDVEIYSDEKLKGSQMREIRYGLERKLDISFYANKYLSDRQMHEIRLGLQDCLDVSSYARIIYSATDMREKRMALFNEKYGSDISKLSYDYDDMETGAHIYVEPGLMEAGVVLKKSFPEKFTKADLKKLMNSYDITEGFVDKLLPQNLSNLPIGVKIPVMMGKNPVEGKDGYYEYAFSENADRKPVIKEDGSVDFMASREYTSVKGGDLLATYHKASKGVDGMTVTGMPIKGAYGEELEAINSEDVMASRDGTMYYAKKEGYVSLQNGTIRIIENLLFDHDLTIYDGEIDFNGTVQVKGSVHENVVIHATGDIIVSGYVESAKLVAGRDIIISGGVNADENGSYIAERNIQAGFFENANVTAGGNIETGYLLNCDVTSKGVIRTKGKKSMICGGCVRAEGGFEVGTIGSKARIRTEVVAGIAKDDTEEYMRLIGARKEVEEFIKKVTDVLNVMILKLGAIDARQSDQYLSLQKTLDAKNEELVRIQADIEVINEKRELRSQIKVIAANTAFENSTIEINGNRLLLKQDVPNPSFMSQGRTIINLSGNSQ